MLTRRQVLAGLGGLAVLGVAGVAIDHAGDPRVRRGLHRLGLAQSPDAHVPDAHTKEFSGSFKTAHMPRPVAWTISVPSVPVQGVIYCLHSYGQDHRMAFDAIHLPDVVAAADAPLAVAAVDGGRTAYWHERTDGRDPLAMLLDDFVPMVDERLGSGVRRALLGWSMGGYGALLATERAPDRFEAVAAASPALFTTPSEVPETAFDGKADFRSNDVFHGIAQLAGITVRIDCGTDDPFVDASKRFATHLPGRNHGRFSAGFHDEAYWRSIAPAQIATIADVVRKAAAKVPSAAHDRCREGDAVVFGPRWPQSRARALQHLLGTVAEPGNRFLERGLRFVAVDAPAARPGDGGEDLAVHHRVGATLVRRAAEHGDVGGEVARPRTERDRDDRLGQRGLELVERSRGRASDRRAYLLDERGRRGDIETRAVVVHRCRRDSGLDELEAPPVDDFAVGRGGHRDGPPEVVGNAQAHCRSITDARDMMRSWTSPCTRLRSDRI
jgi:hypothetical protein